MQIAIRGNKNYSHIIRKYFEKCENVYVCDDPRLIYYRVKLFSNKQIVQAELINSPESKFFKILTYKELLEL